VTGVQTCALPIWPEVFDLLDKAFAAAASPPDFMGVLGQAVAEGRTLLPFTLSGQYVNVNDVDSLNWANFLGRTKRLPATTLSVVVQAQGEQGGQTDLARLVGEFQAMAEVGEVVVAAPPGCPAPAWLEGMAKVRWLPCPPGCVEYGAVFAQGMRAARGDLLALSEGSYCFYPSDLRKLLAYIADADLVLGTRTTRQLIQQGSRMRGMVRLAHILLAKLIELLWFGHRVRLTDVGCTYRLFWRDCFAEIQERAQSDGPEFALEMTIETLRSRRRLIEVPVSFLHTNEALAQLYQRPSVFMRMLTTVLKRRLGLA
jgi:hypothetical protein